MSNPSVCDASAILALVNGEPGAAMVEEALFSGALVSSVNLCEVAGKLTDVGLSSAETRRVIEGLGLSVHDFDAEQAYGAGFMRSRTAELGLSLGDCACMTLAATLGLPVLTADRSWLEVDLPVEVRVIR